ncbi:MAG: hypothetical protein IKX51_07215 [Bacteroidales bacterium]|nr:hypothetical protein [Bacteroidales bacterium]
MKKIALAAVIMAVLSMPALFAQNNVFIANPTGNAVSTYKNALYNYFNDVLGGFSEFHLVNSQAADSLSQVITIDRNSRKVSSHYTTSVTSLTGVDYICYTIIDERNGRLNVEAMLINCSTGNLDRMLSRSIARDMNEIRTLAQIFAKQLLY